MRARTSTPGAHGCQPAKTPLDYALRFPAPDHDTPTENGALEYLLDDHLPVFWKRLYALTFARVPGHAVAGDEYLARARTAGPDANFLTEFVALSPKGPGVVLGEGALAERLGGAIA